MSSYLWRFFLEDDAERFRRLLEDSQAQPAQRGHAGKAAARLAPMGSPGTSKTLVGKRPGSPQGAITLTRLALKERDLMGRNVLHLAVSGGSECLPFVMALLAHPLTDPASVDLESGWTALHRALYNGNISAARAIISASPANWALVKTKDHAGETPFELFASTFDDVQSERVADVTIDDDSEEEDDSDNGKTSEEPDGGDEIFTWGSSKNMNLGFADGDDRSYPERPPLQRPMHLLLEQAEKKYPHLSHAVRDELLDATTLFDTIHVVDVQLSKLHSAILTADSHSNLFICGFGRGGRLGFGDEQNTQFTFRPLSPPLLPRKRVLQVALGLDHSVAILQGGEVWTWGSNQWGQLGYTVQQSQRKEEPIQPTPRQVFGLLKKEVAVGCSASRIHTAVFTDKALYTWGKNEGQLGVLASGETQSLDAHSTPRKVAANFLSVSEIRQVVALGKATIVLLKTDEVWILAGFTYNRLVLPVVRPGGLFMQAKHITRYDNRPNYITKIAGGGLTICAMSRTGDVYTADIGEGSLKDKQRQSGRLPAVQIWAVKKEQMAVRDIAVGVEGSVTICTESGGVWTRVMRAKAKGNEEVGRWKFDRIPGLTRIVAVRSNINGAFAALRRDCDIMRKGLVISPQTLWDDLAHELSFHGLLAEQATPAVAPGRRHKPNTYSAAVKFLAAKGFEDSLRAYYRRLKSSNALQGWDMVVATKSCKDLVIPVHSVMLSARSKVLRNLLCRGRKVDGIELHKGGFQGKSKLVFLNANIVTVLNLLYYIYTDCVASLWDQHGLSYNETKKYRALQHEMVALAHSLDMEALVMGAQRMHYTTRSLNYDFAGALKDNDFLAKTDLVLELADGETMNVHSTIMRARSPFFSVLYSGLAGGRWLAGRGEKGVVHVDMKHTSKPIMSKIVSWIYLDWGVEGFDNIKVGVEKNDLDEFLDYVIQILSLANELLLDRLSQVCQTVLGKYVNTRNVASLLMAVGQCYEKEFLKKGLWYCGANLETLLENHLLDELDDDLMTALDIAVRENQLRCFPKTRGMWQEQILMDKYPSMLEDSAKEKERLITSYIEAADEVALSTSSKAQAGLGIWPTPTSGGSKARRKSSKAIPTSSPSVKRTEEIFVMDDDESAPLRQPSPSPAAPSLDGEKGKRHAELSSSLASSPDDPFTTTPKSASASWRLPSTPWASTTTGSYKLGMKEIMAQTSSTSGKSALTAQLESSPASLKQDPTSPAVYKMSQKERKKQQQVQPQASPVMPSPAPITPTEKKMPWNVTQTQKVSLKDVLSEKSPSTPMKSPAPPATTASPIMVRPPAVGSEPPIAGPSTPTPQRRTVSAQPSPVPNKPTPSRSTPSQSTPAASKSSPAPSPHPPSPQLQLSMKEILEQEQMQKQMIAEYSAKRSLEEIQAEQEFMQWWEQESQRVQQEGSSETPRTVDHAQEGGRGRGRGRHRGRGRGRGKGRGGGQGQQRGVGVGG